MAAAARISSLSLLLVFAIAAAALFSSASSSSSFTDENPIRLVTDGLQEIQSSVLSLLGDTRRALSFARFIHRHGKRYETVGEMKQRFEIFKENLKLIRSSNKKNVPYKLHLNQFADWSWEEFRRHRLGAAQNCSATLKGSHKLSHVVLPESICSFQWILEWSMKLILESHANNLPLILQKDWRDEGIVSAVKDQGHCGSCWTFSTTGALEAAYAQAFGKNISLSEQQLVDCAHAFNNFGCNGGLPSQAFEYVKYNGGLDTEEAYPYTAKDGQCKFVADNVGVRVQDSVNITLGAEDELKDAVALIRPVSVAFEVVDGFRFYKEGVYTSTVCGTKPTDVNHAVLAVGYGVEDGIPYWLIKNSWGAGWGDNGYFKMERGKNMCGVATCASYPILA
ncbi:hypothetical protein Cgig2_033921 [Carnegiea gigantea]|uniref:Thiol protease aleurain-like n=1 Tax=Carnegiea gigantea TaxID=171969 RepID=A0A9Q1JS57_9CARY|nr:hypothetical protein Cgig2_033921 [Carnegiea gigantea]